MVSSHAVSSLFDARLTAPRPPLDIIDRPRVHTMIDGAVRHHPVTLVTGGAGTGKTLAVAEWATVDDQSCPVAWLSVDRGVKAPVRLWTGIVRAVRRALEEDLGELPVPESVDEEFVEIFAAWIGGHPVCLVLDDLHELAGGVAWDGLDHLLRIQPPGLRLVLVARHDPPLLLHRLRLAGRLGEVRAADLAFSGEEVGALLESHGLALTPDQVAALLQVTEGWAAGLRLAIMTIEASPDPATAVHQFSGRQTLVAGYLVEEVIRGLGEQEADFLLRTSVADRVCAPLARELTGGKASARILEEIARENALVTEHQGTGWYRYHPLLLQMLRARLRAESPDLEQDLHRRATAWFESRGEWRTALAHAVESGDWDVVGRLVVRSAAVLLFAADRSTLAHLSDLIPPEAAHRSPELLMTLALSAFGRREHDIEQSLSAQAVAQARSLPEPRRSIILLNARVLESIAARRAGDAVAMAATAGEATGLLNELEPGDAPGWVAYRGSPLAIAAIGEVWSGHPNRAEALLREALSHFRRSDLAGYAAIYHQGQFALAEVVAGRIASSRTLALGALEVAEQTGARFRHESAAAWLALAAAEVHRGDATAAQRALELCEVAADSGRDPFVAAGIHVVAVRRALMLGDLPSARHGLAEIAHRLSTHPGMHHISRLHTALAVEIELASGLVTRARGVLATHDTASPAVEDGSLSEPDVLAVPRARLLLAGGQAESVRDAVETMLAQDGANGADAWLVVSLAEDRLRRDAASTEALARALDLAAPEDARLPFLRPGDRLTAMLRRHLDIVGTHRSFVEATLATASAPGSATEEVGFEPLTDRERSVLAYLPTMSSNAEIAEALGISVNTVKQHLKTINRKLGVTSRRDAVRVARRFGLLPADPSVR
ncbi:MAG: LuxR C-terminal-related transcriptional regulator [Actinomycetota bacterium]